MSKHVRLKVMCEIEFYLEDLDMNVFEDIREVNALEPTDAITDENIKTYIYETQDVYELNDQFGIVDADITEIIIDE